MQFPCPHPCWGSVIPLPMPERSRHSKNAHFCVLYRSMHLRQVRSIKKGNSLLNWHTWWKKTAGTSSPPPWTFFYIPYISCVCSITSSRRQLISFHNVHSPLDHFVCLQSLHQPPLSPWQHIPCVCAFVFRYIYMLTMSTILNERFIISRFAHFFESTNATKKRYKDITIDRILPGTKISKTTAKFQFLTTAFCLRQLFWGSLAWLLGGCLATAFCLRQLFWGSLAWLLGGWLAFAAWPTGSYILPHSWTIHFRMVSNGLQQRKPHFQVEPTMLFITFSDDSLGSFSFVSLSFSSLNWNKNKQFINTTQ